MLGENTLPSRQVSSHLKAGSKRKETRGGERRSTRRVALVRAAAPRLGLVRASVQARLQDRGGVNELFEAHEVN